MAIVVTPNGIPGSAIGLFAFNPGTSFYSATDGTAPYTYSIVSGALPLGVTLQPGGGLTGDADVAATSTFTVRATDSLAAHTDLPQTFQLKIGFVDGDWTDNSPLPVGQLYQGFAVGDYAGATAPISFSVHAGTLPPGTSLNPATGEVSGVTTTAGTFDFTIRVTDVNAQTADCAVEVVVELELTITNYPSTVVAGTPLAGASIQASGGTPPYTYAADVLPSSIVLDPSTGVLSGSFDSPGVTPTQFSVVDADALTGTLDVSVDVLNAPSGTPFEAVNARIPVRWNSDDCLKAGHQMARLIFDATQSGVIRTILRGSMQQPIGLVKSLLFNVKFEQVRISSGDLPAVTLDIVSGLSEQRISIGPPVEVLAQQGNALADITISGCVPFFVNDDVTVTITPGAGSGNPNSVQSIPCRLFFLNWEAPTFWMHTAANSTD